MILTINVERSVFYFVDNYQHLNQKVVIKLISVTGVIPLRTHIITEHDDIAKVCAHYAKKIVTENDIICVAESVVAISQGRYYDPDSIKAGTLAQKLCNYTRRDGSLTNPASMELAIRESGYIRILAGSALGAVGKLLNQNGLFFQVAGPQVARIDDVARTMSPFDKFIVLGPKNPRRVAESIAKETGASAAVVDVNDLQDVDILGTSPGLQREQLYKILKSNPFGNDDQKTPIIVIKRTIYSTTDEVQESAQ